MKRTQHSHKKQPLFIIAFALVGLLAVNSFYIIFTTTRANLVTTSTVTSAQATRNASVQASVKDITTNDTPDPAFAFESGETMLIMTLTVKNISRETQHFIPVSQLYIRSETGDYSPLHPSMYVTNPLGSQDLTPGQTVTGQVSFVVAKHSARPLLYIDTAWSAATPLTIDILH